MSTSYPHFTTEERESLVRYQASGFKQSGMARRLKRVRSSISRELHRNGEANGRYSGFAAEEKYRLRGHKTIHERPRAADTRSQFGHWEGDTLQGARGKGAVATFVDRRSGFLVACLLPNRKAKVLVQAQYSAFAAFLLLLLRSFIMDNRNEFFDYKDVE